MKQSRLTKIIENIHFPYVIVVSFLLIDTNSIGMQAIGAALQLFLILFALILRQVKFIGECNCYGKLIGNNKRTATIFNFVVILSCLIIFSRAAMAVFWGGGERLFSVGSDGYYLLMLLVSSAGLLANIRLNLDTHQSVATATQKRYFQSNRPIGTNQDGTEVTLSTPTSMAPLVMLVGLSTNCDDCNHAKHDLLMLAETFSSKIQTIFLCDNTPVFSSSTAGVSVLKYNEVFFVELGAAGYPYAVLVNPADFSQMGVTVYTSKNIWTLFHLGLNLLTPIN